MQAKDKYRGEGKGRNCFEGAELFQFLATHAILHQEELKKSINRKVAAWQIGCFEKNGWSSGSHFTKPPPYKMNVLPKQILQIILAAEWLMRHLIAFPKQQRRPLPFLLYLSFFYDAGAL